jgi:hypothetical protein
MAGVKKGILKGFLELDEKLRKIPEVRQTDFIPGSNPMKTRPSN